jgi:PTS system nitrogen regulatory IIA component
MPHGDFNLAELAEYLHITPQQVERLASRDQIPGRKVAGQWRFSRADVHHWMEERMGVLDDAALQVMEGRLRRQADAVAIRDLLPIHSVAVPLQARTKASAISEMCLLASASGRLWDADTMAEAVRQREELLSTALDNGIALLHPRRPLAGILAEPVVALGVARQGIPFGRPRLTDVFFLIGSVDDRGHLLTLARLSRMIAAENFLDRLRSAQDAVQAYQVVIEADDALVEGDS